MTYRIDKVGIVGAGTMGGGIAAHLANIGIPVVLLDIPTPNLSAEEQDDPQARNRLVQSLYDRMAKAKPANLARKDRGDLITADGYRLLGEPIPASLPTRLVVAVDAFGFVDAETAAALSVPLKVDARAALNWDEAH